jgi:phage baseplate assembly protein W
MEELGREFLGEGWAFPVRLTDETGRVETAIYEADVQQSIRIILATSKGERVMRPDFGCGIHDLVFAAVSTQLVARIKREVQDALRDYEARIDVLSVDVLTTRLAEGRLDVVIDYRVRATNQTGNFVYPFYFQEAS